MLSRLRQLLSRGLDRPRAVQPGKTREPEERRESKIRFLHEQDGEAECTLKAAINSLLVLRPAVMRAYLARVDYGNPSAYEVVLCLASPEDPALVSEVASVFAEQFGRDAHLDILFLNALSEAEVRKVCGPFYETGG